MIYQEARRLARRLDPPIEIDRWGTGYIVWAPLPGASKRFRTEHYEVSCDTLEEAWNAACDLSRRVGDRAFQRECRHELKENA